MEFINACRKSVARSVLASALAIGLASGLSIWFPVEAHAWPQLPSLPPLPLPQLPSVPLPIQLPGVPWGPDRDREIDQCHQNRQRNLLLAQSNLNAAVAHRNSLSQRMSDLNEGLLRAQRVEGYIRTHFESQSRFLAQLQSLNGSFGALERVIRSLEGRSQTHADNKRTASWWVAVLEDVSVSLSGEELNATRNVIGSIKDLMNSPDQLNKIISVLNAISKSARYVLDSELHEMSLSVESLRFQLNQCAADIQNIRGQIQATEQVDIPQADSQVGTFRLQVTQYTVQECN